MRVTLTVSLCIPGETLALVELAGSTELTELKGLSKSNPTDKPKQSHRPSSKGSAGLTVSFVAAQ